MLNCRQRLHFDPAPLIRLFAEKELHQAEEIVCRMLEDIAMQLDLLQRGLAQRDFVKAQQPVRRIALAADRIGLIEVGVSAGHVRACLKHGDGIALEATVARLERGFDVAVTEIWSFRDL